MAANARNCEGFGKANRSEDSAHGWSLSRRSLLGAGAILGLAAMTHPAERAFAWSSWTNMTSPILKRTGMGDCVHEDLVQIAYARMLRTHASDADATEKPESLLSPWAGAIRDGDSRYATIAGDIVDAGKGKTFAHADDLAARLYRENLAYLRIGSFWNDAAANTLLDFGLSCFNANSVPTFSGRDYYEGAWDVGQHLRETNEYNKTLTVKGRDALVQFTMNDRNGFIHGMLTSTASHSGFLTQSDVKKYALEWLGVAYEYARTGVVTTTSDVPNQEQAEKIFKGFIDTYGQLDENAHDMRASLKTSWSEASIKLPRRRMRLRALGMMCHTMEDLWCPAHTCRTYHDSGNGILQNSILAFSNYKLQNGSKMPLFGYHIPFDRYATSDFEETGEHSTNWREALTRGEKDTYAGTETLENALASSMDCLANAHTYFNTLGMNETIACITQLFDYLYQDKAWDGDDGVRKWVDEEVMPTYFDVNQSYICDAGRRSLHSPTFLIAPIQSLKRAYKKVGLTNNYDEMLRLAKQYDAWQRGAHRFYSGKYNTRASKYIVGNGNDSIWNDAQGETWLVDLVDKIHESSSGLTRDKQSALLANISCNGCHDMISALGMVGGMLQEFSIDLRGSLRPSSNEVMVKIEEARSFFESGLKGQGSTVAPQSSPALGLLAAEVAYADEVDESFVTANMALEDIVDFEDGSYLIAVRDMDSLETSIMAVPNHTPNKDRLKDGITNLTITYTLETEFEGDLDYRYVVAEIDDSHGEEDVHLITGLVKSVSADAKSLVLDLNGISELALTVRSGVSDVPQAGDYICARYSSGNSNLELVGYDELEDPGELVKVTYPVAMVAGSNVWLLTNEDDAAEGGTPNYLQVDYGLADILSMPLEGHYATVYYHDEEYGSVTGVDEDALAGASVAAGFPSTLAQAEDDESDASDSATPETPEYLDLDDYGNLNYGDEVFHVANVIVGLAEEPDDVTPTNPDDGNKPSGSDGSNPGSGDGDTGSDGGSSNPRPTSPATTPRTTSAQVSGSPAPKTDDPLAGLGGLLSAAAVAGTAMAAYSARRIANERESSETD